MDNQIQQNNKLIATETMVLFKIVGICILITLLSIPIVYFSTNIGPQREGINLDYTRWLHRKYAVKQAWPIVFMWSLMLLIGGRYIIKLYQWARNNSR